MPICSLLIFTGVSSPLLPNHEKCGIDTQDKIYGGKETGLSEYPWMVLVEYEKGELFGFYSLTYFQGGYFDYLYRLVLYQL